MKTLTKKTSKLDKTTEKYKRLRRIWWGMQGRCFKKNNTNYHNYGGRGITVCDEWNDFEKFYSDIGKTYNKDLTLDRIDNDKGYSKENCRWATMKEQHNNRRGNTRITFNGETKTISEWADKLDMKYGALLCRLIKYGWSVEQALTISTKKGVRKVNVLSGENHYLHKLTWEKVREIRKLYKHNTRGYGYQSLAKKFGVSFPTIEKVVKNKIWKYDEK